MVEKRCTVHREGVYRWFSQLNSAQRAEFLCGLLDLCVPIELRFLGSCLEDLARKDYHSLRDAEIKANNPADLANLTNITDEVVRSKLLISLALLNSDNREAAGVLFRTLTHIDSIINNYGLQLNDGHTGDQFLLLFTMASNHPAFSFHQKQVLRQGLVQIQGILQTTSGEHHSGVSAAALAALPTANTVTTYITTINSCYAGCTSCRTASPQEDGAGRGDEGSAVEAFAPMPSHSCQELPIRLHAGKSSKADIERIELKGFVQKSEKSSECTFEVLWSDSTTSTVTRSTQEVTEFLSKISQLFPEDGLEKFVPLSAGLDSSLEPDPRCFTTLPPHLLKRDQIRQFFSAAPVSLPPPSANLACSLQYRGANSLPRPVCGVASIQPVISSHCSLQPYPATPLLPPGSAPVLPPLSSGAVGEGGPTQTLGRSPAPQPQAGPEQNGILDWLRKLRLHKYYPVFKQLTMEKFLALTEEDLNKYDLTQGAKKKLKTQLELQNREKSEKKYVVSQFPVSCSGVARVTPSSHISPVTPVQTSSSTELRLEVETSPHSFPRDSGSSSGYCSSPSSPMGPLSRDDTFDRVRDPHRRPETGSDREKDRCSVLLNHTMPSGSSRPTAQVLPVQNDPSPSPSSYHLPLLSPARILSSPRKPRPPPPPPPPPTPVLSPLCADERAKPLGLGAMRLEGRFPGLSVEVAPPTLQDGSGPAHQGPLAALLSPPGSIVETSMALTSTSNTLHHVTHPTLQLQPSSALPPDSAHRTPHYAHPRPAGFPPSVSTVPMASVSSVPMATACSVFAGTASSSSVPMATVPGNTYCVSSVGGTPASGLPSATPSSSPGPAPGAEAGQANAASVCVCSSCGCSGNCGSYNALPASYAGYFQHPFSGPPVFTLGPLLHLSPLLTGPHPQQHSGSAAPFSYPIVAPPLYSSSLPHETQPGFVLPPMQGFLGGGAGMYQPQGMLGNGGTGHKKAGNMSCYNCGVSGHRAQDCKQPPMDSAQQGTFRLKYAPPSDGQDSGD
ncbi:hypothetical protein GJAV_G00228020 [Gymnothorax javanicus]|nr:hypothetical protein GJAV_G00228020 [Gymnothorax javanicus]